jgi:tyrosyl-tRNA synthetase
MSVNLKSGLVHLTEEIELDALLATGKPLRLKAGFDPTAPDLHLGHAVLLKKLRQFQEAGHTVVLIIGDTTAAIGDPTGRNNTRPPLQEYVIAANAETYLSQVFKILIEANTVVRYNSQWLKRKPLDETIELCSTFTLAQMLQRDDFRNRFEAGQPIHLHELLYPLMQAYDSYWEGIDVEFGGTDQLFNLMVGRDYMRLRGSKPQIIATVPLLVGLDGVNKMSKSLGNHIGITEQPFEMFSKVMSISDETMLLWWDLLLPNIKAFIGETFENNSPMEKKLLLGWHLVSWLHSTDEAHAANDSWKRQFSNRQKPLEVPEMRIDFSDGRVDRLMVAAGLASSISAAQRLIAGGGVEIDGQRVARPHLETLVKSSAIEIRVGRKWMKVNAFLTGRDPQELEVAIETAMLAQLDKKPGPVRLLTQDDFGPLVDAVLLAFHGRSINTVLLAELVAKKLCIIA